MRKETKDAYVVVSVEFVWFHFGRHLLRPARALAGIILSVRFSTKCETICVEVYGLMKFWKRWTDDVVMGEAAVSSVGVSSQCSF